MKNKIITSLLILAIFFPKVLLASEENKSNTYEQYKKNVGEYCLNASFYTESHNEYVYKYEKYQKYYPSAEEIGNDSNTKYLENKENFAFEAVKEIYRDTQNKIYGCGIISAKFQGLKLIEENVKLDKTGTLKSLIDNKLKPQIERLKQSHKECKFDDGNLKLSKKQILDQSTFELCKYVYYLDYLKSYYSSIDKSLQTDKIKEGYNTQYRPDYIAGLQERTQTEIDNEKEHSYKIYPLAFTAYTEYQSHYPIHIALVLLKDNLIVYRDMLYKALSPISQTVYKVINAMSE